MTHAPYQVMWDQATETLRHIAPVCRDLFVQALARDLVLQGKGPDTAARLARATWAELYPQPAPTKTPPLDRVDPDDLYHAAKAGK